MRVLARTLTTAIVGSARALSRSRPTASLSSAPTVKLNDGTAHPQIGFGTYKVGFIPASASAAVAGAEESGGHLMVSYQWDVQSTIERIVRSLEARGYDV